MYESVFFYSDFATWSVVSAVVALRKIIFLNGSIL